MFRIYAALGAVLVWILMGRGTAQAHVVCGDRVFPATLTMDDPGVSDEVSLPTITLTPTSSAQSNTYGFEWDKTITEDLGFGISNDLITQRSPGQSYAGWDNWEITLKDQHPCSEVHPRQEFVWAVGVVRGMPLSGSKQLRDAGIIEDVGSTSATFYFGKGFGTASGYLRPLAITGEFSRDFSDNAGESPAGWSYAASFQYSMPYLQQNVKALHIPQFFTRLTPLVEVAMSSPDSGGTPTGTISPGFLYDANTWQIGAEAVIPANGASRLEQGTGFIFQYHLFLDSFNKSFFGRPLINTNLWGKP
jgi:hypothetical protein